MAITIRRGSTEDAQREYTCYYLAYACMAIKTDGDSVTLWTFDEDAADVFAAMEYNEVTDIKTGEAAINYFMEV